MIRNYQIFFKLYWSKTIGILVFVLLFSAYIPTFAIDQQYSAGETLDPACSPGEVNCTVRVMSTPSVDGTAGQVLSTDGSGVLSWITASSGLQTPWTSAINAAGYTLNGNSTASGNLTLDSTSHATKGYVLINSTGGNVGIGTTAPTAVLHLKAGTATASTAPLKFTSGTLLTTPEAGAIEFLTDAYYGTITTGGARKQFAFTDVATLSSLSSVGTITTGTWSGSFGAVSGANLTSLTAANLSGTIPSAVLGNSTVYIGTTAVALNRASSALVLTGITSIDGNAATVTTNANLTGPITSVGNATSVASQTGTGSTFVMDTSPTLVTPILGVASATTINKVTITTPATGSTLTIADGKVLTVSKTISFTSADDTGIYTLPTGTKTLVATDVATLSSLSSVGTITTGTWSGSFGAVSGANLTSLTAANLSGTIPSAVLGNSTVYIGTTAVALNRASSALVLTGITSIDGNAATATSATSATTATTATNIAGGAGGQIVYQSAAGTTALLANGTAGQVLQSNGTTLAPSWVAAGSGSQTPWTSAINAAGYTLNGNSTASGNLTLDSTSHATKGYVLINPTGGNVGIGTTAPGANLSIVNQNTNIPRGIINYQYYDNAAASLMQFGKARGTLASPTTVVNSDYIGGLSFKPYDGTAFLDVAGLGMRVNGTVGTNSVPSDVYFYTSGGADDTNPYANGHIRLLISSSGNVGIGTTAPVEKLEISGAGTQRFQITETGSVVKTQIKTSTTAGYFGTVTNHALFLQTNNINQLTIDATGKVGIGTTTPSAPLEVKGTGTGATIAKFTDVNTTGCAIATGGTIACSSDVRLKKNIEDINYGLDTLLSLRSVLYNWNYEEDGTVKNPGFIAQEVETVIPKLVSTDVNGMKSLNTIGVVPVLVKAIQELNLKINDLSVNTEITPLSNSGNEIFVGEFFNNVYSKVKVWFASAENGIGDFFANRIHTKELCVSDNSGETCITREQLDNLLIGSGISVVSSSSSGGSGEENQSVSLTAYDEALTAVAQADYTEASWTMYQEVVIVNVVTASNTQEEIDIATNNITTAQSNLERVEAVQSNPQPVDPDPIVEPIPEPVVEPVPIDPLPAPMPEVVPEP